MADHMAPGLSSQEMVGKFNSGGRMYLKIVFVKVWFGKWAFVGVCFARIFFSIWLSLLFLSCSLCTLPSEIFSSRVTARKWPAAVTGLHGVHDVTSRSGNKNKLSQIANIFQIRLFNFVFQVSCNINAKLNKPDILLANLVRFVWGDKGLI